MSAKQPIHLLVVDDDELDQRQIARLLRGFGDEYFVSMVDNGTAAFAHISEHRPDLVLLDMILPDINGIDFLAKLPREERDFPIVVLTGQGSQNSAVATMKAGATDYLVKGTLSAERLVTTITNALAHERSETERRQAIAALERSTLATRSLLSCAQTLLLDLVPARTLSSAMGNLQRAVAASSLSLWRHDSDQSRAHSSRQITAGDDQQLPTSIHLEAKIVRWHLALSRGEAILAAAHDLTPDEMSLFGLRSTDHVALIPFYMDGRFAGMLVAIRPHAFTNDEKFFLQGAGDMLTAWLERREATADSPLGTG